MGLPVITPRTWFECPSSRLDSVAPSPLPPGGSGFPGLLSWTGGWHCPKRNWLGVGPGGGHADYAGPEVYIFDVYRSRKWVRFTEPPTSFTGSGPWYNGGTTYPRARHAYQTQHAIPETGKVLCLGAPAMYSDASNGGAIMQRLDMETRTWDTGGAPPISFFDGVLSARHPINGKIWAHGNASGAYLVELDPITETWIGHNDGAVNDAPGLDMTAVIHPAYHRMYAFGAGKCRYWELAPGPQNAITFTATGDQTVVDDIAPGCVWDYAAGKIVCWAGGSTVYEFDPTSSGGGFTAMDADAGNTVTPPTDHATGVWGRFAYFPGLNIYALCNDVDENVFLYRHVDSPAQVPAKVQRIGGW